MKDITREK